MYLLSNKNIVDIHEHKKRKLLIGINTISKKTFAICYFKVFRLIVSYLVNEKM